MRISEIYRDIKYLPEVPAGDSFTSRHCDRRTSRRRIRNRRKIERSYFDRRACDRRHGERRKGERRIAAVSIEFDDRRKSDRRGLPDFV